ncbi:MAG: hypothetical protein H7A46_13555 [Verrucomicrobiales bacterium]|nr:hypothetical protein [Verrucomicrobiales bacterium]
MDRILGPKRPPVYEQGLACMAWVEPLLVKRGDRDCEQAPRGLPRRFGCGNW